MKVVISQSMMFPWVGMLEQIKLADIFVHYDDVQFSKGSFTNRVQIKTPECVRWLTVPLPNLRLGQPIERVVLSSERRWREDHLNLLSRSFSGAPYRDDALMLAEMVYKNEHATLSALARSSMLAIANYYDLLEETKVIDVGEVNILGRGSQRVLDIVKALKGDCYITGHGAKNYLDHKEFEEEQIDVRYMSYQKVPYPQLHGAFTPYVSGLDLVANCGKAGIQYIVPCTMDWRDVFLYDNG